MKPENILQADLLDIVFLNRNKAYGAYALRKNYNSRLLKSFAITLALSLLLAAGLYIHSDFYNSKVSITKGLLVHEHILLNPVEEEKKKEVAKKKNKTPEQFAQKAHVVPKIVKDHLVDKNVPEIKEFDHKLISNIDKEGMEAGADKVVIPWVENGEGGNRDIAEKHDKNVEPEPTLLKAEVMPEFPGGMEAFKKFMLRNLRQPELGEGEKVVVKVKFVVDADGSINKVQVIQSGGRLDGEVLRVVGKMPKWKPGVQNGRFVAVYFTLPVTFLGPGT